MNRGSAARAATLLLLLAAATLDLAAGTARNAAAQPPPKDIGAFLQAGARLEAALVGRRVVTRQALPGSAGGLVIRPDARSPLSDKSVRAQVLQLGQAYAGGDTLTISRVQVSRREIALFFGAGGYEESSIAADGRDPPYVSRARWDQWALHGPDSRESPDEYQRREEERRRKEEEETRQAMHDRDLARATALQTQRAALARTSGARIRLVFRRDIPLDQITERALHAMLGPYLVFVD
jgi:hypothetical protein